MSPSSSTTTPGSGTYSPGPIFSKNPIIRGQFSQNPSCTHVFFFLLEISYPLTPTPTLSLGYEFPPDQQYLNISPVLYRGLYPPIARVLNNKIYCYCPNGLPALELSQIWILGVWGAADMQRPAQGKPGLHN